MENKKTISSFITITDLVQVSLMAALTYVTLIAFNVPIGSKAVLHLGDGMVFLAAVLLGRKKAFFSAAIGCTIFDILSPYIIWAPFTFIIKGTMGYIVGLIAYRNGKEGNSVKNNILAFIIGGLFMTAGYFVAGRFIYGSFAVAMADIPGNILQIIGGMAVALPLSKPLKKALPL